MQPLKKTVRLIRTANKIRRFERRNGTVEQQLERLTDPTFIERISQPEILNKPSKAYSKRRELVQ